MRHMLIPRLFNCLLCVTLLFVMGFGIETGRNRHFAIASGPSVENAPERKSDSDRISMVPTETLNSTAASFESIEPLSTLEHKVNEQHTDEPASTAVTNANYEVTAYQLNVRAEANDTSQILDVVTKGTLLEVVQPTGNGWMELKAGGFVHGGYVKRNSEDSTTSERVNKGSDIQTAVQHDVGQASQTIGIHAADPRKPSSMVKSDSGLTEEHISTLFKDTALEGEGLESAILEIEKMYGINAFFTIAVMKLESGHGKSKIAKTKNNLFGLNALDSDSYYSAISFQTKGESVEKFGQIISEFYLDNGLTSIDKVAVKYCGANSNWASLVKSIMNSDYKRVM